MNDEAAETTELAAITARLAAGGSITLAQLAKLEGISTWSAQKLARSGRIKTYWSNGHVQRVTPEAFADYRAGKK